MSAATIHLSDDRSLYYVTVPGYPSRHWVSVEKFPGPVSDAQKGGGVLAPDWAEVGIKSTGEVYHRKVLPFAGWKVATRLHLEAPAEDVALFVDYAVISGWDDDCLRAAAPEDPPPEP